MMFQSILNQTNERQERNAYELFKQLCQGRNVEPRHPLYGLKLNVDEDNGKAWRNIPELAWDFGLWQHTIKQIYCSFLNRGTAGARAGIVTLAITDEHLCGLIRRYSAPEEVTTLFGLPLNWEMCAFYKHRWCTQADAESSFSHSQRVQK